MFESFIRKSTLFKNIQKELNETKQTLNKLEKEQFSLKLNFKKTYDDLIKLQEENKKLKNDFIHIKKIPQFNLKELDKENSKDLSIKIEDLKTDITYLIEHYNEYLNVYKNLEEIQKKKLEEEIDKLNKL